MAFLLGLGEADKARAVAQRALQTIHYRCWGRLAGWLVGNLLLHLPRATTAALCILLAGAQLLPPPCLHHPTASPPSLLCTTCREEGEKFNVWVALLNLEAAFGQPSPDEALMAAFSKAAQYCDQKKLYFALLGGCGWRMGRGRQRCVTGTLALCKHPWLKTGTLNAAPSLAECTPCPPTMQASCASLPPALGGESSLPMPSAR